MILFIRLEQHCPSAVSTLERNNNYNLMLCVHAIDYNLYTSCLILYLNCSLYCFINNVYIYYFAIQLNDVRYTRTNN